jgi:hypothetical protein
MKMMIESVVNRSLFETIKIKNVMTDRMEALDLLLKLALEIGNLTLQKLRVIPQKWQAILPHP